MGGCGRYVGGVVRTGGGCRQGTALGRVSLRDKLDLKIFVYMLPWFSCFVISTIIINLYRAQICLNRDTQGAMLRLVSWGTHLNVTRCFLQAARLN